MHPLFSKRGHLGGYLLLWGLLALLLASLLRMPRTLDWREALTIAGPLCLLYAFVCLTPWYVCRYLPLNSTPAIKVVLNHLGTAVLATALWVELARLLANVLGLGTRIDPAMPPLVAAGLLLYSLSVALHYTVLALESSREAALQARDAELRALKAQINPHFLFNSLNSIAALSILEPAKAREMCINLSDFLRNTLGLGERDSISWREEVELARTYLHVEQVRFGSRLKVEMNVDDACANCQVPPLVLQPLIENAVKHGIATMLEGGTIRVESHLSGGLLEVIVENHFDPDSPSPSRNGLGLRNVRGRLETRFGGTASLSAQSIENLFRAEMTLPCEPPE